MLPKFKDNSVKRWSDHEKSELTPDECVEMISVEVAFANPERQLIVPLNVAVGTTAYQAAVLSNIAEEFEEIDLDKMPMGIFSKLLDGKGKPTAKEYVLQTRDRVEIYRPLIIDPKEARLSRAAKKKANG